SSGRADASRQAGGGVTLGRGCTERSDLPIRRDTRGGRNDQTASGRLALAADDLLGTSTGGFDQSELARMAAAPAELPRRDDRRERAPHAMEVLRVGVAVRTIVGGARAACRDGASRCRERARVAGGVSSFVAAIFGCRITIRRAGRTERRHVLR